MLNRRRSSLLFFTLAGCAVPASNIAPTSPRDAGSANPNVQAYCPGQRLSIKTPPLSSEPYIELTIGGKTGPFLIDFGASTSSVEKGPAPTSGGPTSLIGPGLPGLPNRNRFDVSERNITQQGVGDQSGVIGTDLLSKMVVEMRYDNANDVHLTVSDRCDTSGLAARGFWRFDQKGFFGPRVTDQNRGNIPVLHIDLQNGFAGNAVGAKAWAQIDTAYGDSAWPFSVDINEAYFARLVAANVPLTEVGSIPIKDCKAVSRTDSVYVTPGYVLRLEDSSGVAMYRQQAFHLIRKGKGSGECGGIATLDEPAAQFGDSFLKVFGRTIFDGPDEAVWILPTTFRESVPDRNPK